MNIFKQHTTFSKKIVAKVSVTAHAKAEHAAAYTYVDNTVTIPRKLCLTSYMYLKSYVCVPATPPKPHTHVSNPAHNSYRCVYTVYSYHSLVPRPLLIFFNYQCLCAHRIRASFLWCILMFTRIPGVTLAIPPYNTQGKP